MTQTHTDTKRPGRGGRDEATTAESLIHVRAAAQALHGAISDAATKRGAALKAELHLLPEKARAVTDSIKESFDAETEATKRHLTQATTYVEATKKHVAEALKSSGHELETAVRRAVRDARAAAQNVSEAVSAKRSTASKRGASSRGGAP
jgi:gas vesicle protein